MAKIEESGRDVMVHRLDNGETVTAFKRGRPEWDTQAGAIDHLTMLINYNATHRDPAGYTKGLEMYGRRSVLGDIMEHIVVDDWVVSETSWTPKAHDSLRFKLGNGRDEPST